MAGNARPRFADSQKFLFTVDGEFKKAFIDDNAYEWGVDNPDIGPVVVIGAAGNPDGTYSCYATFYITWPNGKVYETGPSPVGTVVASSEAIEWSRIPTCKYDGDDLIIYRRLYRTVSGTAYLVDTMENNTATTYSDDVTDSSLQAATALSTTGYSTPPIGCGDVEIHLHRAFLIKDNYMYWSESYAPFAFKGTSSVVVTEDGEDLVGLAVWADQLYIASNRQWYRLQGTDPDTWSKKSTFTDAGVINRNTLKKSKYGLIGLWYDGIYLFDGATSKNLTEKKLGREFFTDLSDTSVCYAEFDGYVYHFYYASTGSTLDSHLVLDFRVFPNVRVYHDDFIADAEQFYAETGDVYLAKSGYEYSVSGTEAITTSILTGDIVFGNVMKQKNLEYFYYDIFTDDVDVTVTIYVDGVSSHTITLNNSARERKRTQQLPMLEGYRFTIGIDCADSSGLKIYSPWSFTATTVGD